MNVKEANLYNYNYLIQTLYFNKGAFKKVPKMHMIKFMETFLPNVLLV